MTECSDLCTAAKCQELENELDALRDLINILKATLDAHISQDIPEAHQYNSNIKIEGNYENNGVNLSISDVTSNDSTFIELPFVLQEDFDEHINKKIPDAHDYKPEVKIDLFYTDSRLQVTISVDGESDSQQVFIMAECDLNSLLDKLDLVLSLTNSFALELSRNSNTINNINNSLTNIDNSVSNINNTVTNIDNNVINSTTSISNIENTINNTTIVETDIDLTPVLDLLNQILINFNPVLDILNSLEITITNVDNNTTTIIRNGGGGCDLSGVLALLNNIITELTKTYMGTVEIFDCHAEELDENDMPTGNIIETTIEKEYTGNSFSALYSFLMALDDKLSVVSKNICLSGSEVVAIVSSDKVINNTKDKQLILHFVTFDNYPKRARNSAYRPVQIPKPKDKDNLKWEDNFEPLTWVQGNLYCELFLAGYKTPVSGYFADKDAADAYFNSVLNLTTLAESNRIYHERKFNNKSIPVRITRPYRAFIISIDNAGNPVCEAKFVPPIESNGNP